MKDDEFIMAFVGQRMSPQDGTESLSLGTDYRRCSKIGWSASRTRLQLLLPALPITTTIGH